MKYNILFFIFVLFSGSALADWASIRVPAEWKPVKGEKDFYIEPSSIKKSGDRATMWSLINYGTPMQVENMKHLSSTELDEYDCKDKKYKTLAFYWYPDPNAKGNVTYSETTSSNWEAVISNSPTEVAWKTACGIQ
ncbi:surface-adhesin E family protein [Nitrosomonas sp. Is37]|uniref:surface-adhesin E family protein n=1 Tax=Nitrosomonas sp. Is37 TaxID=3080535 RepID=UPI00294B0D28|nr:surface-adhesin E family protein [Nitrosomonas sp. Is37]MDV6343538.1 hypothetical protein [Nitrosomonas sp. Is37]